MTTTQPDIYWAVTREILAVQLPCSRNWGGVPHLLTEKKLWLIGAWQELPGPSPEPTSPSWVTGRNRLAPSGFRVPICEGITGTPLTRSPRGRRDTQLLLASLGCAGGEPRAQTPGLDLGHSNPVGAPPSLASVSSSVERCLERRRPRGRRPGVPGFRSHFSGRETETEGASPRPREATARPS